MVPAARVRRLGVGRARARDARLGLGRLAVPPRGARRARATARPPWTRSSRSARRRPTSGRSSRCSPSSDAEVYFEVDAPSSRRSILLGRWLEARARRRSGAALRALLELGREGGARAPRRRRGRDRRSRSSRSATCFVVRPGEKLATDGVVVEGALRRRPVDAHRRARARSTSAPGDEVAGATVNASGRLVVRATRVGADTALAQIARLVAEAQAGKAPIQRLADRVSAVFVPIVIALSLATLAGWLARSAARVAEAFTAAVAVLIIACPCALGLATPTALMVGTGRGAQLGIVIKGPEVLEQTRRVDTDRPRQDRHGHRGPHGARRRRAAERRDARRRPPAGRRRRGRERAPDRAGGRGGGAAPSSVEPARRSRTSRTGRGVGVVGPVEGHAVEVGPRRTAAITVSPGTASRARRSSSPTP